jgi:hypothetical protein
VTTALRLLARVLGLADPFAEAKRQARLKEDEARDIAEKAAGTLPDNVRLQFAAIVEEAGERLWVFSTNTRGLGWEVKIRDRDGRVGNWKGRHPLNPTPMKDIRGDASLNREYVCTLPFISGTLQLPNAVQLGR